MRITFVLFFAAILFAGCSSPEKPVAYGYFEGFAQGTTFHIKYKPGTDSVSQQEVYALLSKIDKSLSIYNPQSVISKINNNEDSVTDEHFNKVLRRGFKIYDMTDGAFDMTVGSIVKAYGFGPDSTRQLIKGSLDSLLPLVGMDKIKLSGTILRKNNPGIQIDANAIAQGYAVDVIAEMLESKGITDYMVEIGGEVRVKGLNDKGENWKVGIDRPVTNSAEENRELQAILSITNKSIATSGSYRKFYEENGIKYSHTINPKTGLPTHHNLLSVTLLADDCMNADAFATALMVMGLQSTQEFVVYHKMDAFLIYVDESGAYRTWLTPGLDSLVKQAQ